jgi:osmoprotectant transport system permease protein
VRNTVTGLDGVPADVKDAAVGMGYSRGRQILRVELPLALPAIIVGIRIATVTTIGLVTVTALIGQGGLGALMLDGFQRDFRTPLTVGIVLSLALAVVADVLLVLAQRLATPWARADRRRTGKATV